MNLLEQHALVLKQKITEEQQHLKKINEKIQHYEKLLSNKKPLDLK